MDICFSFWFFDCLNLAYLQGWTARWRETLTDDSFDRLAPPNSMSAEKWADGNEVAFLSNGPEG